MQPGRAASAPPSLIQSRDGRTLLHIWRTGQTYRKQNEAVLFSEWNNVYFSPLPQPKSSAATYHDLTLPLPFADNSFDAIYVCRVMEHLSPNHGARFVADLFRLLKPGGVCRLSTPDLEEIAEEYLRQLKQCWDDPADRNLIRFHWIKLQMLDQMVREKGGGDMMEAIHRGDFDPEYAKERFEDVFNEFLPASTEQGTGPPSPKALHPVVRFIRRAVGRVYRTTLGKRPAASVDPRRTFEADKWLHDRLSLRLCMEACGFHRYRVKDFRSSDIPGWDRFRLDTSRLGDHPLEPSLFVEAHRP
jgi:SAM-dependent methyltransferase